MPDAEHSRIADQIDPPAPGLGEIDAHAELAKRPDLIASKALLNPPINAALVNHPGWRSAEVPAANGHATARAVAAFYGDLTAGRLVSPNLLEQAIETQSEGPDATLPGLTSRFGLGFMLNTPDIHLGPNPRAFGHPGMGGSLGFGDPDLKLGFGFTLNQMHTGGMIGQTAKALIEATYQSLR